jgi:hypothetical protein
METRRDARRIVCGSEVAQRHGQSVGLQMVGTLVEVADQMEDYIDQVGGDGFMLSPIYTPGAIEEFVDLGGRSRSASSPPIGLRRHHATRPPDPGVLTPVTAKPGRV